MESARDSLVKKISLNAFSSSDLHIQNGNGNKVPLCSTQGLK
jgi:hypothetical protein